MQRMNEWSKAGSNDSKYTCTAWSGRKDWKEAWSIRVEWRNYAMIRMYRNEELSYDKSNKNEGSTTLTKSI